MQNQRAHRRSVFPRGAVGRPPAGLRFPNIAAVVSDYVAIDALQAACDQLIRQFFDGAE